MNLLLVSKELRYTTLLVLPTRQKFTCSTFSASSLQTAIFGGEVFHKVQYSRTSIYLMCFCSASRLRCHEKHFLTQTGKIVHYASLYTISKTTELRFSVALTKGFIKRSLIVPDRVKNLVEFRLRVEKFETICGFYQKI